MSDSNTVLIGKKPVMNYVLAGLTLIQNGSDSVMIKARGRAISKAVDVAQIITKRFATDIGVKNIEINTEQVKSIETGNPNNVSSIEILLGK
ncbi:MAG: DNA-binding protein Alba [Nitrososphaerales archaeon]